MSRQQMLDDYLCILYIAYKSGAHDDVLTSVVINYTDPYPSLGER